MVHLRCRGEPAGTLCVATGPKFDDRCFELEAVCESGSLSISDYPAEQSVQFTLQRSSGERVEPSAEYGDDIQRDQGGFYIVLKITEAAPFLVKDRI